MSNPGLTDEARRLFEVRESMLKISNAFAVRCTIETGEVCPACAKMIEMCSDSAVRLGNQIIGINNMVLRRMERGRRNA